MASIVRKVKLWQLNLVFFIALLYLATFTNHSVGVHAAFWVIPLIIALVGLIGSTIGAVIGGSIGLISKLSGRDLLVSGIKYGATLGYFGLLFFWFLGCWMKGSGVCLTQ